MPTTRPSSAVRSERAYIGAVLLGYARASDSGLRSDDFTDSLCRRVYAKCLTLEAQGRTADLVTVCDDMEDTGALIDLTGEASVEVSLVEQHCANIRTASMRREVTDVCTSAVRMAFVGSPKSLFRKGILSPNTKQEPHRKPRVPCFQVKDNDSGGQRKCAFPDNDPDK